MAEEGDVVAPQMNPATLGKVQQLGAQARKYNTKGLAQAQSGVDRQGAYKNLASEMSQNNRDFNSRGLLYSGARVGANSDAMDRTAANLGQKRMELNQNLFNNKNEMEQSAIGAGTDIENVKAGMAGNALDMQLAALKANQEAMSNLGQGLGGAIGAVAANNKGEKPSGKMGSYSGADVSRFGNVT